jgi:Tol biopolymer transport system component
MSEVRVILEEIKAAVDAGISMDPQSADRILQGRRKVHWPLVIVPGGFLVAAVVVLGYLYLFGLGAVSPYKVENFAFRKLSQSNDVVLAAISPNAKTVAYNTIGANGDRSLWIRLVDDKAALRVIDPVDAHFWGGLTFSEDGGYIYYITAKKDAKRGTMYRISTLGGSPRKLIENVNDLGSVSPDGKKILFVRYLDKMQLMIADSADGSGEATLLTGGANIKYRDPQFSSDGEFIYFIKFRDDRGEEYWSLVEIPAEGGDERVIIPEQKARMNEIVVLKSGEGLLMNAVDPQSNLAQLYYVDASNGSSTRITNDLNIYFGISVSDDGKTIVAAQRVDAKDIWVGNGARLSEYQRVTSEPTFNSSLTWSPDGKILYDSVDNNRPHIWIMNADGSNRQQLTPDSSNDVKPAVSVDGKYVYFVSDRSGESKVWRMNIDGTSPKMVLDEPGATEDPIVGPDGNTLYFLWTTKDKRVIAKLELSTGTVSVIDQARDGGWTLSPDGTRVAYRYYDPVKEGYSVAIRPVDSKDPEKTIDISPVDVFMWTPDGEGLLFLDFLSKDNDLSTVWRRDVGAGQSTPYLHSESDLIYKLAISKDGKRNAVVTRRLVTDAVMLTRRD